MSEITPNLIECRVCGQQISSKAKFCQKNGDRYTLKEKYTIWKKKRDNRNQQIKSEKKIKKQKTEEKKWNEVRSYGDPAFVRNHKDNEIIIIIIFIFSLLIFLSLILFY